MERVINKHGILVKVGRWYDFTKLGGGTETLLVTDYLTSNDKVYGVKTRDSFESSSRWLNWIVSEHSIRLHRKGDWYEARGIDARIITDVLGITLNRKDGVHTSIFPFFRLDEYYPKLFRAGYKVEFAD